MPRPKLAILWILWKGIQDLFLTFQRQRVRTAFILASLIFVFAMIFSFLAFAPVLSPFVYPLF